jgi:hypothetical protein
LTIEWPRRFALCFDVGKRYRNLAPLGVRGFTVGRDALGIAVRADGPFDGVDV